jgi:hypothetical protein
LRAIILDGQKSVNRQLSRASKILIRLKVHTSIRTLVAKILGPGTQTA